VVREIDQRQQGRLSRMQSSYGPTVAGA
jgi:hypothetical protein